MLGLILFLSVPILSQAIFEEAQFRLATKQELSKISQQLKLGPVDLDLLKTQVQQQIDSDIQALKQTSNRITSHPSATWSFKTNKLLMILEHTKDFFKQYASELVRGDLPRPLQDYWDQPRWMSQSNLEDLALKTSWVLILRKLNQTLNLDQSSFLHSTPMPTDLEQSLRNLSFVQNHELTFVHGGYAFGGQRQDPRYFKYGPFGKALGPQDCSSWISKLIGAQTAYSTSDFADYTNPEVKELMTLITVRSIQDLKPGMIWVTRTGNSGHVNVVSAIDIQNNRVSVIEYARNLPDYEGFGFRNVTFKPRSVSTKDYWFWVSDSRTAKYCS